MTACVLGIFPQLVAGVGGRKGRQEWVNMTVFFLFGVSAFFGLSSGHRVPEKLGVVGLRSLKKGSPNSLLTGPTKVQVINLNNKRNVTLFVP